MKSFFEHQHLARRNTKIMVLLFLLAVAAVVLAVDMVLAGAWVWAMDARGPGGAALSLSQKVALVPRPLLLWGAAGTAAVIFIVSMVNVSQLASGGAAVAAMVGARRVPPATEDVLERRLLNVVEEMAIASGVRVPAVYVMEGEQGINAFAAGWDVSGSVVAVTRGTLERLTRDELQGVIAHEFSHILNGDMRLNIRMIGVLAGIVFIGSIGEFIMRSVRDDSRDSKNAMPIWLAGLALFIIGYVGLFFARLIKAAVSRQREFLADASSVQFTRNPDGIAGALDQIRRTTQGSLIANRYAEDMSHMFFGQGVRMWFGGLFDTHPPVEERIRRANPRFQAQEYQRAREAAERVAQAAAPVKPTGRRAGDLGTAWGRSATESANLVGTVSAGKLDYAASLLASLPPGLEPQLRNADGARAVMVALLLAPKPEVAEQQLAAVAAAGAPRLVEPARAMAAHAAKLGPAYHLPVIDLGLSAVRSAPEAAKQELVRALEAVIHADRRVSLHEFVVLTFVRDQLAPKAKPGAAPSRTLADLKAQTATALAIVSHAGTRNDATGERQKALEQAYRAGAGILGLPPELPGGEALTLEAAAAALQGLKQLAPMQKGVLVKGLFAAVTADGTIKVIEAELMRLVGALLDCPLPPLLEDLTSFS
jgi:Zn-dependent protease with chaperone function